MLVIYFKKGSAIIREQGLYFQVISEKCEYWQKTLIVNISALRTDSNYKNIHSHHHPSYSHLHHPINIGHQPSPIPKQIPLKICHPLQIHHHHINSHYHHLG